MKHVVTAALAVLLLAALLSACSAAENDPAQAKTQTQTQAQTSAQIPAPAQEQTQPAPEQSVQERAAAAYAANPDYVLPEEDAKEIAYTALEQECKNKTFSDDINHFTFDSIKRCDIRETYGAFNRGNDISAYNTSSHPYYAVRYNDSSLPGNYAYFCIDLRNGDLLYTGYMGD